MKDLYRKALVIFLIVYCLVALFVLTANAAPSLACDWVDGIQASEIEVNGTVIPGTVVQSGMDMLLLDLAGYSNGAYVFRARFIGMGGWPSEWSVPLDAVKPASGGVLRIKR